MQGFPVLDLDELSDGFSSDSCPSLPGTPARFVEADDEVLSEPSRTDSAYSHIEDTGAFPDLPWRPASSTMTLSPMTPLVPSPWSHRPSTTSFQWSDQEDREGDYQEDEESDQDYCYESGTRDTQDEEEHEICKTEIDAAMEISTDVGGAEDEHREEEDESVTDVEAAGEEKLPSTDDQEDQWYGHYRRSRWPNWPGLSSDVREAYSL